MPVWLAELAGQALWRSSEPGVAFVGAMVAVGSMVAGIGLLVARWAK